MELTRQLKDVRFSHPFPKNPKENACQPMNVHTLCKILVLGIQAARDFFRATPTLLQLCAGCLVTIEVTTVVSWH